MTRIRNIIAAVLLIVTVALMAGCQSAQKEKEQQQKIEQQEQKIKQQEEALKKQAAEQRRQEEAEAQKKKEQANKKVPFKFSNFAVKSRVELNTLIVRVSWVMENPTDRTFFLTRDNFILTKEGHNGCKSKYQDGGFSKRVESPSYTNENYDFYPGDRIAVSMDFWTDERHSNSAEGWQLCYADGGKLTPILNIK